MLRSTMKGILSVALGLTVAFAVGCGEGAIDDPHGLGQTNGALDPTCGSDPSVCEHTWLNNKVTDIHWGAAATPLPTNDPLYLAGAQNSRSPQEHGNATAGIPDHDHIVTRSGDRVLNILLLQAGPHANSSNLKQRLDPAGTGLYMPYAVHFDYDYSFTPLTNAGAVQRAISKGILVAVDVGLAQHGKITAIYY
jgi:hypothetical protein